MTHSVSSSAEGVEGLRHLKAENLLWPVACCLYLCGRSSFRASALQTLPPCSLLPPTLASHRLPHFVLWQSGDPDSVRCQVEITSPDPWELLCFYSIDQKVRQCNIYIYIYLCSIIRITKLQTGQFTVGPWFTDLIGPGWLLSEVLFWRKCLRHLLWVALESSVSKPSVLIVFFLTQYKPGCIWEKEILTEKMFL